MSMSVLVFGAFGTILSLIVFKQVRASMKKSAEEKTSKLLAECTEVLKKVPLDRKPILKVELDQMLEKHGFATTIFAYKNAFNCSLADARDAVEMISRKSIFSEEDYGKLGAASAVVAATAVI